MQRHRYFVLLRTTIVAIVLLALVPAQSNAAGQTGSNSYESTLGYVVSWDNGWEFDETLTFEAEGVFDIITLWNADAGFMMISGITGQNIDPAELLQADDEEEVISSDLDAEVPQLVTDDGTFQSLEEGYVLENGTLGITVSVTTMPADFDSVLANAQDGVQINGSPVLMGQPLADADGSAGVVETEEADDDSGVTRTTRGGTDTTETATEESGDSGVTRTTRGSSNDDATIEPTEEVTQDDDGGVTRTTRGSSNDDATVEPTEGATRTTRGTTSDDDEPSGRVSSSLASYQGPVWGYTFEYDDEIWQVQSEYEEEGLDGLSMSSSTSTLTIWAWDGYGGDPQACLDGEADYYANDNEAITDWEQVVDANGEPLRGDSDDISWGVYSLLYTNERGNQTELIDYISCQTIPGEDAVLVVLLSSAPENYNDNLDLTFDVLDTLQFGDAPVETSEPAADPTEEVAPTEETDPAGQDTGVRTEVDTSFDGSQYTSPLYGFTVYVPLDWQIVDESVDGDDEQLVIDNGTSVVTLWATPAPRGDLEACVDFAAESSGKDLQLLTNSTGGDFRGVYGDEAFGNFTYTDGGTEMMYFISCRTIPGSDAVLILTQDVPFEKFTSERRMRNEIEESITMP